MRIIDQKFHDIMYKETHFFRITDIVDNKASGVLNISGTSESIKARLVCPLHASYTIGNIIPVKVILCQVNEVIVEPN